MLKLILKNLWARRVRNAWLLAELILVTVLTWYITDPLFVLSYNQTLPLGYEPDGLLIAPIRSLPSTAPDYNKEEADSLHTMENMHRMLRKLRDYPGVQNAAPLVTFAFPGSGGSSYRCRSVSSTWQWTRALFIRGSLIWKQIALFFRKAFW